MTQRSIISPQTVWRVVFLLIVVLGAIFRFTGINWDGGHHLHPDERFISMVLSEIGLAHSVPEYLDVDQNPLSPYLTQYHTYVYGQLPLTIIKYLSVWLKMDGYDQTYILGRTMSALLDTVSIILVFLLGRRLFRSVRVGVFAAFSYTLLPLTIQYSHFMVMESWSSFFWLLTLLILVWWKKKPLSAIRTGILGISLGAAGAVKATSVFLALLVGASGAILALPVAALSFRFFSPTIFRTSSWFDWSLNTFFRQNLEFQQSAIKGIAMFPPQLQWVGTTPIVFPAKNLLLWGIGVTPSILILIGAGVVIHRAIRKRQYFLGLLVLFVIGSFLYNSIQFIKTMRYLLPFFGLLAVFGGVGADWLIRKWKTGGRIAVSICFAWAAVFAVMFTSIYRKPTTRVAASEWIYQNIPSNQSIMLEEWDDPLPLGLPGRPPVQYHSQMVQVYAPDDEQKRTMIDQWLSKFDWVVLSSHRAKKSIGRLPEQFPLMHEFYRDLDAGILGFQNVATITSFPSLTLGSWTFEIDDSGAEEQFWIFDHPTVEIYKKVRNLL